MVVFVNPIRKKRTAPQSRGAVLFCFLSMLRGGVRSLPELAGLRELAVPGVLAQVEFAHLPGLLPTGEQVGLIQSHAKNGADGLVGLDADEPGGLGILPAQIQAVVAVVGDGGSTLGAVDGVELGDALQDDADADVPGTDHPE